MATWGPAVLLWLGALHLHKKSGLPPAAAHLCVLLTAVLGLSAAAMLNVLPHAAAALFLGVLAVTVLDLRREGRAWLGALRTFWTRPVQLALAAGVLLTVIFAVQQPIFTYWDEFLIAGTNAKVMKLSGLMYRVAESPALSLEDPCGAPVLSYLYQFFSPSFSESDLYLSYGCLYFAVFAAAAEQVERHAGRRAGSLFFVALALTPFLQGYHAFAVDHSAISYGYASSLADYMLAVGMFACVVLYRAAPHKRWYWAAMAFTCLLKESGVLFAAVMAAVLAVWRLPARGSPRKVWQRWAGGMALDLAVAAGSYLVWLIYVQLSGPASPIPGMLAAALLAVAGVAWRGMGSERRGTVNAAARRLAARAARPAAVAGVLLAVAGLLLLRFSSRFAMAAQRIDEAVKVFGGLFLPHLRTGMWQTTLDMEVTAFLNERLLYPIPDWLAVLLLCLAVCLACLFWGDTSSRLRLFLTQVVLVLGAMAYLVTMAYFVAHHVETQGLMEYPRYFTSYLFGWAYAMLFLLLTGPGGGQGRQLLALGAALACAAVVADVGVEHTVVAAPENYQQAVRTVRQLVAPAAALQPGDRVYLVIQSLDSYTPMVAGEYLYPVLANCPYVDTDLDYATIFCAQRDPEDPYSDRYHLATPEEFTANMQRNFDYILVTGDNGVCQRDYGALFEGGFQTGGLYRITQDGATPFKRVTG